MPGFKKKYRDKYIRGQIVAIKEFPESKENQRFGKTGTIVCALPNDSYIVKTGERYEKRNHADVNALMPISVNPG